MKIRTGDTVMVMSGKDKGTQAVVTKAFPVTGKVLVEGVNVVTRHVKKHGSTPGQIVKYEKPIDASNVMLVCPHTSEPTRVGYTMNGDKKFRYSKKAVKQTGKKPTDCII